MSNNEKASSPVSIGQEVMLSRYQRAQSLLQGLWTKNISINATVYPTWIDGCDCFWYERELRKGKEYRLVDANAKSNIIAFDHDVLASALSESVKQNVNSIDLPITDVTMQLNLSAGSVDTLCFRAFDKHWTFDTQTGICKNEKWLDKNWSISPNGKMAVFVKDFNLWLYDIDSGEDRALTQDGEEYYVYGVAGSAWGYTMESAIQACWSADSTCIFTVQRDTRRVKDLPVVHHVPQDGGLRPTITNYKIAYPGDEHVETLRLLSIDVNSGRHQEANYRQIPTTRNSWGFFSSNMGWWSTDSRHAYFVDMERDYKRVRVVEFDTHTGNTKILFEETADTHINLMLNADEYPTFEPLPETNELLWYSERSGWAHLYLYDMNNGQLKSTVTRGDWLVRNIISVNTTRREAFIQTAGRYPNRDPYYRDLCRVHLDTGDLTELSSSDHEIISVNLKDLTPILAKGFGHDIADSCGVSPSGSFAVITRSRADEVPVSVLLDRDGQELLILETANVDALPNGWKWPEPVKLLAADGKTDIYGLVFRPSDFSPEQSYPVISSVFNTPELPNVAKASFSNGILYGCSYFEGAMLSELGFIVVQIDGRGTPYRQKAFFDECYGWAESVSNLEDHITGIKQLAERYPYMDLNRVGISSLMGGPGGVQGLLQYPDFYKVGISNFLHDSRLMPASMWGEKFEDLSGPNKKHLYPEELVDNLQGKLLIMNGMLDHTTSPTGIFRLVDALHKANKDFDLLLLPNTAHQLPSYTIRRAWDYLVKHLINSEPPKEFKLRATFDLI